MRKTANEIRARPDEINSRPIVELHYKINKQKIRSFVMDNKTNISAEDLGEIAGMIAMGGMFAAAVHQARSLHYPPLSEEKRQQLRNKRKDNKK